jgi:hypothetical protein
MTPTKDKLEQLKWVIGLLVMFISLQIGNLVIGVTNTVNGQHREVQIQEIKDDYMPYMLMLNFLKSFQYQMEEAGVYARKDSSGFARASEKYNELRLEWMKDMKTSRGESTEPGTSNIE